MKPKDYAMFILGALIAICFFTLLGLLVFKPMPQENKDVLYLAVGALIGFMGTIVTYFYGSSAGSAKKDETLNEASAKKDETISKIATDK